MTVTRLGQPVALLNSGLGTSTNIPTSGTAGQVVTANGSNGSYWGPNVATITSNGSNTLTGPFISLLSGSGVSFAVSSNALTISGTVASGSFLETSGGGKGIVVSLGALGSTETVTVSSGNYFYGTLDANCTIGFTGWTSGKDSAITVELTENGTGGWTPTFSGVTWLGGTTPSHTTTAGTRTLYIFLSRDGGTTILGGQLGGGGGTTSPLTTIGDLYTYSTVNARLAVGSNGTGLYADSTQTTGNRWTYMPITGELLMADGVTAPPVPIETEAQDDWLYADI